MRRGARWFSFDGRRSIDGRTIWLVGTGSSDPGEATSAIAAAAGRNGFLALADATAARPVRELTGKPADRHWLLPGIPPAS